MLVLTSRPGLFYCLDAMEDTDATYEELQERMDAMEEKIERLREQVTGQTLVSVQKLAEQDNAHPDTYDGMIKKMRRRGVPKRTASFDLKEKGSKAHTFVSLPELELGEELGKQSLERDAGVL